MNTYPHRLAKGAIIFGYPASALRREAARGKLTFIRVGNRDYVCEAAIRDMEKRCEIRRSSQDSEWTSVAAVPPPAGNDVDASAAQAALRLKLNRRKCVKQLI